MSYGPNFPASFRRADDYCWLLALDQHRRTSCTGSFAISSASWSCGLFAISSKRVVDSAEDEGRHRQEGLAALSHPIFLQIMTVQMGH